MRRHAALLHRLRAADVIGRDLHAGDQLGERPRIAAGRDAFENFLVHHRLLHVRADVHRRRFAGDGDRLADRADFHLAVDGRDERGADAHVRTLDGAEALQLELDVVGARHEAIEAVRAAGVADLRLRTADQAIAAERDGHARQDRAAGVGDDSRDRSGCLRLCKGGAQQQCQARDTKIRRTIVMPLPPV